MATRRSERASGRRSSMSSFALFPRTSRLSPALKPSRPGVTTENLPQALSCPLASLRREGFAGNFSLPVNHFVAARAKRRVANTVHQGERPCLSLQETSFSPPSPFRCWRVSDGTSKGMRQGQAEPRPVRTMLRRRQSGLPAKRRRRQARPQARSAATMISRQAVARPGSRRGGSCASNLASGLGNDLVGICQPCRSVRLPVGGVRTRRLSLPAHHVAGAIFFAGSCAALAC